MSSVFGHGSTPADSSSGEPFITGVDFFADGARWVGSTMVTQYAGFDGYVRTLSPRSCGIPSNKGPCVSYKYKPASSGDALARARGAEAPSSGAMKLTPRAARRVLLQTMPKNTLVSNVRGTSYYMFSGFDSPDGATRTADAINRLIYDALQGHPVEDEAAFQLKAAAWRAQATKPALSQEVYRQRLLAEAALNGKNTLVALDHYENGIAADPTWAEGWFDSALIYATFGDYLDAAGNMKRYLDLAPNAPDSQAAKDNVILWENKVATSAASARQSKR